MTPAILAHEFGAKVKAGIFRPVGRHLSGPDAEDKLQEGICQTFEMYRRYALDRGVVLDDGILVHSCRQRAVDLGRRFVKSDSQPRRDALHPANYRDRKTEVYRLDGLLDDDGELPAEGDRQVALGLAEMMANNPTRQLIAALDLQSWLSSVSCEDRRLLAMRYAGSPLQEIADAAGVSISSVFKRLRDLGWQLADRAELPIASSRPTLT